MGLKERRAREREHRKSMILDAARKLLFENGPEGVSMSRIACRAELGVGTIYFYFKSKEEIFLALQEEGLEMLRGQIASLRETNSAPDELLRQTALAYLQFSERQKDYFDIINRFLSSSKVFFEPDMKNRIDRRGSRIIELIVEMVDEGKREGIFRDEDSRKCALVFWGSLHGVVQLKKMEGAMLQNISHNELFEHAIKQLISGLK